MDSLNLFTSLFSVELSEESKKDIYPFIKRKSFKKGDVLTQQNEIPHLFYILLSGIVRSFITDDKGKERIRTLFVPITTTGSLSSLISKTPSNAAYDCLSDCIALECNFNEIKKLMEKHHDLSLLHSQALERSFIRTEDRIYELSVLDAKERYLKLKKDIPNIDNLITQYHIAAYLNITPVQLSRIRKDLYSK